MPILRFEVLPTAKLHLKHGNSGIKAGTFNLRSRLRFPPAYKKAGVPAYAEIRRFSNGMRKLFVVCFYAVS